MRVVEEEEVTNVKDQNKNKMNTAQIILSFDTPAVNGRQLEPQLTQFNIELSEIAIKYFGSNKINLRIFDENWKELPL